MHIRALALYSTVDNPSNVLESCPTRKKLTTELLFYFLLRHAIIVPCNRILFRRKIC